MYVADNSCRAVAESEQEAQKSPRFQSEAITGRLYCYVRKFQLSAVSTGEVWFAPSTITGTLKLFPTRYNPPETLTPEISSEYMYLLECNLQKRLLKNELYSTV